MPVFKVELGDTEQSVVRPVAKSILGYICRITKISQDDIKIFMPGESRNRISTGSAIDGSPENAQMQSFNSLNVDVKERFMEMGYLNDPVYGASHQPIFHDEQHHILWRPIYARVEMTLSVTYRADSYVNAERWLHEAKTAMALYRTDDLVEAAYTYRIPHEMIIFLNELHKLKENQYGNNEDLGKYLTRCGVNNLTFQTQLNGKNPELVMRELQQGINGAFSFTEPPEQAKNERWPTVETSFEYKILYQKPIAVVMDYPIVINNQLIPPAYVSTKAPYMLLQVPFYADDERLVDNYWISPRKGYERGQGLIRSPYYNEFFTRRASPSTFAVFYGVIQIDETDPTWAVDINNIGEWQIDPDILAYMKENYRNLQFSSESAITTWIYKWQDPVGVQNQYCTPEGMIHTREPMDFTQNYNIRIGVLYDWGKLSPSARRLLQRHPNACKKLLKVVAPHIDVESIIDVLGNEWVTDASLDKVIGAISQTSPDWKHYRQYKRLMVNSFFVTASAR